MNFSVLSRLKQQQTASAKYLKSTKKMNDLWKSMNVSLAM